MNNKRLIEKVRRRIKDYEKYNIAIHDEKWKDNMIRDALIIMACEKDRQFEKIINKELSKLNPCATTRISVLNDLRSKIE
jgi:hypothetical protein